MSQKQRFMSRRAILAAAGLTPAALLALSISPEVRAQISAALAGMQLPNEQGNKLARVIESLWTALAIGAKKVEMEPGVLQAALGKSLTPILNNLASFPDDGKHVPTLICAFICGDKAAAKAGNGKITPAIFNEAWTETKNEMSSILAGAGVPGMAC